MPPKKPSPPAPNAAAPAAHRTRSKASAQSDEPTRGHRMAPMAAGTARNVQVVRCVDAVAAAEILAIRDLAQCILGALDERHLVIDPGKEAEFAKAAVAHRVVLGRGRVA